MPNCYRTSVTSQQLTSHKHLHPLRAGSRDAFAVGDLGRLDRDSQAEVRQRWGASGWNQRKLAGLSDPVILASMTRSLQMVMYRSLLVGPGSPFWAGNVVALLKMFVDSLFCQQKENTVASQPPILESWPKDWNHNLDRTRWVKKKDSSCFYNFTNFEHKQAANHPVVQCKTHNATLFWWPAAAQPHCEAWC